MDKVKKSEMVRLSVDMEKKMHHDLRCIAAHRNCTMRKLVIRALVKYIQQEKVFVK